MTCLHICLFLASWCNNNRKACSCFDFFFFNFFFWGMHFIVTLKFQGGVKPVPEDRKQ